jgi:hypothetical protein
MEMKMRLTPTEVKALQGIANSEFQDGPPEPGKPVWTWSANLFDNKRVFAGAVASLVKKGLVGSANEGANSIIWLTQAGLDALANWELDQMKRGNS